MTSLPTKTAQQRVEIARGSRSLTPCSRHAFIKNELFRNKTTESRLAVDPAFQSAKRLHSLALAARQRYVRMIGAAFRDKPTKSGSSGHALLQRRQFWREPDTGKENPCALKEIQVLQLHRHQR